MADTNPNTNTSASTPIDTTSFFSDSPVATTTRLPTTSLTNLQHFLTIKLTKDNYLLWRAQILPYLRGQELFGYINGTIPMPTYPDTLVPPSPETIATISHLIRHWKQQDQIILSALISSLTEDILAHVINESTSRSLWLRLEKFFASQNQARVLSLKRKLSIIQKGDLPMVKYIKNIQTIGDHLASAGHPICDTELVDYLLAGLGPEYDSVVTSITVRDTPMSFDAAFSHLCSYDNRQTTRTHSLDLENPSANAAYNDPHSSKSKQQPNNQPDNTISSPPARYNHYGNGSSRNYYVGRGGRGGRGRHQGQRNGSYGQNRYSHYKNTVCQVCSKSGHTALQCYRLQQQINTKSSSPPFSAYASGSSSIMDNTWYPDTGSTNHLTLDLENLNIQAHDYVGSDSIRVGNGQGLPIHHTGPNNGEYFAARRD